MFETYSVFNINLNRNAGPGLAVKLSGLGDPFQDEAREVFFHKEYADINLAFKG